MDRRRLVALPLALAASLTFATAALGGGWATASLDSPPPDPRAGGPVEIDLAVLQHGVTPIDWIGLTVVATNAATGEAVTAAAQPAGSLGHYVATLTFPSAGDWSISYRKVISMRYLLDLSEAETAAALGVPAGTVKSRLSRALGRLRAELATIAVAP